MRKVFGILNYCARLAAGFTAAVFLLLGVLSLWSEMSMAERAFTSNELMSYKPVKEENGMPDFGQLSNINPDVVAWITIFETNIDYPVLQGSTDMEYINKDAYGDHSISGSIFLSVTNKSDFSESYQLIYGHNMENGSMFGDIDRFLNETFFYCDERKGHDGEEGYLITKDKIYDLYIRAILKTDAFDPKIYKADKKTDEIRETLEYVKEKAICSGFTGDISHVVALSTCDGGHSYGRLVLICEACEREEPLPSCNEEETSLRRMAAGHPETEGRFAFLNLAVLMLTLYMAFPLHLAKKIYLMKYTKANIFSFLISAAAMGLLMITENFKDLLTATDRFTPVMIIMAALIWLIRYQESKTKEEVLNK